MQNIKKLKSKSIEGLEVRNYQTFPSMEWGEDGGLQADLYYNGKFLARIYNEGNGGCAIAYMQTKNDIECSDFKKACFDFLIRNDKNFGPQSQYEFMRDKTPNNLDDDDFETVINLLKERHDHIKEGERALKRNWGKIAIIDEGYKFHYYMCSAGMTKEQFLKNVQTKCPFELYTLSDLQQAF